MHVPAKPHPHLPATLKPRHFAASTLAGVGVAGVSERVGMTLRVGCVPGMEARDVGLVGGCAVDGYEGCLVYLCMNWGEVGGITLCKVVCCVITRIVVRVVLLLTMCVRGEQ